MSYRVRIGSEPGGYVLRTGTSGLGNLMNFPRGALRQDGTVPALPLLVTKLKVKDNAKKPKKYKACQYKAGAKKGKLRKGWRFNSRGQCVKAKSAR